MPANASDLLDQGRGLTFSPCPQLRIMDVLFREPYLEWLRRYLGGWTYGKTHTRKQTWQSQNVSEYTECNNIEQRFVFILLHFVFFILWNLKSTLYVRSMKNDNLLFRMSVWSCTWPPDIPLSSRRQRSSRFESPLCFCCQNSVWIRTLWGRMLELIEAVPQTPCLTVWLRSQVGWLNNTPRQSDA